VHQVTASIAGLQAFLNCVLNGILID
jgi:hypothetical protein